MPHGIFRIIVVVCLALVVLVLLGVGALHLPAVQSSVWDTARDYLERDHGLAIAASRVRYNLPRLWFSFEDLRVASVERPDMPPVLSASRADINLGFWPLLAGAVHVDAAAIDDLEVDLAFDEEGRSNLPLLDESAAPDTDEDGGVSVRIRDLEVDGSRLLFTDAERGIRVELPSWALAVSGAAQTHRIDLEIARGGRLEAFGSGLDLEDVAASLTLEPDALQIESFEMASAAGRLSAAGSVSDFSDPALDVELEADLDAAALASMAAVDVDVGGRLLTEARIRTDAAGSAVDARIRGDRLRAADLGEVEVDSVLSWAEDQDRVRVEDLSVGWRNGTLDVSGEVSLAEAGPSRAVIEAERLDLEALSTILDLPVRIASRTSGSFTASWPGLALERASGVGQLTLAPTRSREAPDILPLGGRLLVGVSPDSASVEIESLDALGLIAAGQVSLASWSRLDGSFQIRSPDAGESIVRAGDLLGGRDASFDWAADLEGPATVSGSLGGSVENPVIGFSAEAPSVDLGGGREVAFSAAGSYAGRLLRIESAEVGPRGRSIALEGAIDFGVEPAALRLTASADRLPVATVLEAVDSGLPLAGELDLIANVAGSVAAPIGEVHLEGSSLEAYGDSVGMVSVRVALRPGRAELTELSWVEAPEGGSASGEGVYEFDSGRFEVRIEGEGFDVEGLALADARRIRGRVGFLVQGQGTLAEPMLRAGLNAEAVSYGPIELGSVNVEARLEGERLEVETGIPLHNLSAAAGLLTRSPYPAEARLEVNGADLGAFEPLLEGRLELGGMVTGMAEASGELDAWRAGSASLRLASLEARVGTAEVSIDDEAVLSYENRRLVIEPFVLVAGGQRLTVRGDLPVEPGQSDGVVNVEGSLDVGAVLPMLFANAPVEAGGVLSLDAALEGNAQRIEPAVEASLRGGFVTLPNSTGRLSDLDADLRISEGLLVLEHLGARWAGAPVEASGRIALAGLSDMFPPPAGGAEPAAVSLEATSIPIASIPGAPAQAAGTLSVTAEAEAESLTIDAVAARIEIETLDLSVSGTGFQSSGPLVVTVGAGEARIEPFLLAGSGARIEGGGAIALTGSREIRIDLGAETDASLLASAFETLEAAGDIALDVELRGTLDAPDAQGSLRLTGAAFGISSPALEATGVDASVSLTSDTATLERLSGNLNGGSMEARGTIGYDGFELTALRLEASTEEILVEAPEGLETLSSAEITIGSSDDLIEVAGSVEVLEGYYTRALSLSELASDYLGASGGVTIDTGEQIPLLSRVRFDISIETARPVIVSNNVAELAADANLTLVGSYYSPSLVGRISIEEGGTIEIQETQFALERGVVDFERGNEIEPVLDIVANSTVDGVDVTLQVTGGARTEVETTLSSPSNPELSEPDIIALLLTGRTLDEVRGAELNVAREQALSYLTGAVGARISAGAEQALGLSRVQIEPNLIAGESDPGARLTIGQNLTRDLELIYSMDLTDSNDQIWIAEYDVTRRFVTRGIKQEDNTYRFELRHDLTFGGMDRASMNAAARAARTLRDIQFEPAQFGGERLGDVFGLEAGGSYTFLDIRRGVERLEDLYAERGYLEARARADRTDLDGGFGLGVAVEPGPTVDFQFRGADLDRDTVRSVRDAWRQGRFDAARRRDAVRELERALVDDGFVRAEVALEVSTNGSAKSVVFQVRPGDRYRRVEVNFEGLTAFEPGSLRDDLRDEELWLDLHIDPPRVATYLEERFQAAGYLDAEVGAFLDDPVPDQSRMRLTIPVMEGPLYRVGEVRFEGNARLDTEILRQDLDLEGEPYTPELLREAVERIEERYWNRGYNQARIEPRITRRPGEGRVEVVIGIVENRQDIVRDIRITGNRRTSESLIRTQLDIEPGEPLDFSAVNRARRNLYDTGAYALVQIDSAGLEDDAADAPGPTLERPVRLSLEFREVPPVSFGYGGFYDTERGAGTIVDLRTQNWLGSARTLGVRGRYDGALREVRTYFSQPALLRLPVRTNLAGFFTKELDTAGEPENQLVTDRTGFSLQQETLLADSMILDYGYRFENTHQYPRHPEPDPLLTALDERRNVASLTTSLTRDTRDDILDAARGSFTSHAVEYASRRLGSGLSMFRYSGQGFFYLPLADPTEIPYTDGVMKSRFSYAAGARVGFAVGLAGDDVPRTERFFAGGGTSIRGFEQDLVGPFDIAEDGGRIPAGGDAMLVINNELRFPIFNIFDGVVFLDAGNVYGRIEDFDPFDLRSSAGFGLRVRTPWFLLRADYGMKLQRRAVDEHERESAGALFFSIGQAF